MSKTLTPEQRERKNALQRAYRARRPRAEYVRTLARYAKDSEPHERKKAADRVRIKERRASDPAFRAASLVANKAYRNDPANRLRIAQRATIRQSRAQVLLAIQQAEETT